MEVTKPSIIRESLFDKIHLWNPTMTGMGNACSVVDPQRDRNISRNDGIVAMTKSNALTSHYHIRVIHLPRGWWSILRMRDQHSRTVDRSIRRCNSCAPYKVNTLRLLLTSSSSASRWFTRHIMCSHHVKHYCVRDCQLLFETPASGIKLRDLTEWLISVTCASHRPK